MGNFLSSLFGSSQTSTYQPPEVLKNAVTDLLTRAGTQSQQPYPQYTPQTAAQYSNYIPGMVAPMTPNQAAAGQSISNLQGYTAPNFAAATGLAGAAASPIQLQQFGQGAINQYMSPYLSNVLGAAVANINQTNAQQQQQVLGNAIQRGAFGGDRAGIAQAELARQQNLANNATIANLLNQGYGQAMQQFNTQQAIDAAAQLQNRQLMSNAALNLANLGTQGQQAALQQAQAQYGYGTAEQQQQQAGLSTAYQQFLNQYAYPYQQLGWYSQLASGTAPALGASTTQYSPTTSPMGVGLGGLMGLGALTNPSMQSTNPFAYANAGMSAIGSGLGSIFGMFKDGGRVGYAEGGAPVADPSDAYNDYVALLAGRAPLSEIQDAYLKYLNSFKGGAKPWETTPAPTATTPAAAAPATAAPAVAAAGGGGGGDRNVPTTVQNAVYSPDYTRSNGPVGGVGGYGPYYAGGGPGTTFNEGGLGGVISGIIGALTGAKPYQVNPEEGYTGTVSEMGPDPYGDVGTEAASRGKAGFNVPDLDMQRLADINAAYGLPEGYLQSQAQIESRMNPNAKNPYSSAAGLFQIMKSNYEKAGIDPYDPYASAEWAAENAKTNAGLLAAAGIPVTGTNLALAHNFGIEGAKSLLADPNATMLDAFKDVFSNPVKVIASNKYNISDPAATAIGRIQSRYNAALEGFNQQAPTSMPGFLQQGRGSNITDARPYGSLNVEGGVGGLGPRGSNFTGVASGFGSGRGMVEQPGQRLAETAVGSGRGAVEAPGERAAAMRESGDRGGRGEGSGNWGSSGATEARDSGGTSQFSVDRSGYGGPNESTGESRTYGGGSQSFGIFKRGGLIHKARGGGFEPITMQYGLPTEEMLQQAAQSFAGSGAGTLPVTATALAAKGVLPSKRGGRIHKDDGGGLKYQGGNIGDVLTDIGNYFNQKPKGQPSTIAVGGAKPVEHYESSMAQNMIAPAPAAEAAPAPKTKTLVPARIRTDEEPAPQKAAPTQQAPAPQPEAPVRTAPQTPQKYEIQAPADMMNLAALQFAARLMSPGAFGTNMANAASDYARSIMAQQEQQRATAKAKAEAAEKYAAADLATSQSANQRIVNVPGGYRVVTSPGQEELDMKRVRFSELTGGKQPGAAGALQTGELTNYEKILQAEANKQLDAAINDPAAAETAKTLNTQAQADYQIATNGTTGINQTILALSGLPESGPLVSGPYSDVRFQVANTINALYKAATGEDLGATGESISNKQELDKLATWGAQNLGRENAATWKRALQLAQPSAELTKATANDILSAQIVDNRRVRDRGETYATYQQMTSNYGANAPSVFNKVHPPGEYERDRQIIRNLLNGTQNGENLITKFINGEILDTTLNAAVERLTGQKIDIASYFK